MKCPNCNAEISLQIWGGGGPTGEPTKKKCEALGPITGKQCERESGHAGQHYVFDSRGSGEAWFACGAVHPVYSLPCAKNDGHDGSHGYNDGKGGVSWSNDSDTETDRQMREGMREWCRRTIPDFPSVIEYNRLKARERRERIATAVLAGFCACHECHIENRDKHDTVSASARFANSAVNFADALIAALDKGE